MIIKAVLVLQLALNSIVFAVDFLDLFRADLRSKYDSLHQLRQESQSILKAHRRDKHTYVLALKDSCSGDCHMELRNALGSLHYQVLNTQHGIVTHILYDDLERSISSINTSTVEEIYPYMPSMKVVQHAEQVIEECGGASSIDLLAHVVPMSSTDFLDLVSTLEFKTGSLIYSSVSVLQVDLSEFREFQHRVIPVSTLCTTSKEVVRLIAQQPGVLLIEAKIQARVTNYWAKGVIESGGYASRPIEIAGLTGTGQIIGIADTGLDLTSGWFYDSSSSAAGPSHRKVVYYGSVGGDASDLTGGHGTHVSGVAAGKALEDYGDYNRYDGHAPDAKIAFYDLQSSAAATDPDAITIPTNIADMLDPLYDNGARVITNSWGFDGSTVYDAYSNALDNWLASHQDALVLFAAGNDGACAVSCTLSGRKTCIITPATAKSVLTVGNSLNDGQAFSSIQNGVQSPDYNVNSLFAGSSRASSSPYSGSCSSRVKPDLTAPGMWVISAMATAGSATEHYDILWMEGTSMATPAVAGAAAIIRQYFVDGFYYTGGSAPDKATYGFNPSGALIKAMLVAATKPLTKEFAAPYVDPRGGGDKGVNHAITSFPQGAAGYVPSYFQGYGRVQLNSVLHNGVTGSTPLRLFVIGDTDPSHTATYSSITSSSGQQTFFITASATNPGPIKVILTYTDAAGSVVGSQDVVTNQLRLSVTPGFSTYPMTLAQKNGMTSSTTYDTVQVISIASPTAGLVYTVKVTGNTISSPQPFALVCVGDIAPFTGGSVSNTEKSSTKDLSETPFYAAIVVLGIFVSMLGISNILLWKLYFQKHPIEMFCGKKEQT